MTQRARRVDQLLSALGYCSRSEANQLCREGRVTLEGQRVESPSQKVDPDALLVDGAPLEFPHGLLVRFHKPIGLVCSHDSREGGRIYDLLPPRWLQRHPAVTSVGRLDKETSGLLLLTDDGALVQRLTSPKHHVPKVYLATLDQPVTSELTEAFARGIELQEGPRLERTRPAQLEPESAQVARVTLDEGRYHQVRRMFAACGAQVLKLHRIGFGSIELGALPEGHWEALAPSSLARRAS